MNWSEFFAMGGYATYVWSSFGLMAFVLLLNLGMTLRKKADAETKARHFVTREKKS
jgi:heme exporter protein D